ncbi:hypothetical protein PR048_028456 [Dryococelus australis]|uniref:Uncharacterized protein n=1 Tax=Dryococelus australis TaxID=614101 RepID=A0ABQ9GAL8_9NEOP|nr:hypothetical protein PR048_028456 [Dryococelus australis]
MLVFIDVGCAQAAGNILYYIPWGLFHKTTVIYRSSDKGIRSTMQDCSHFPSGSGEFTIHRLHCLTVSIFISLWSGGGYFKLLLTEISKRDYVFCRPVALLCMIYLRLYQNSDTLKPSETGKSRIHMGP